jgi:hypothetical protein
VLLETSNFHLTLTELHQRLAEAWEAAGNTDSVAVHRRYVTNALRRADPRPVTKPPRRRTRNGVRY